MNIFYKYATEYRVLRHKSQHHITILTLLFWVWKPLEKPKTRKLMEQSDIDFVMRKYGAFTIMQIHPNLVNAVTQQDHWEKPQLNLSTLLCECTTQLYKAR